MTSSSYYIPGIHECGVRGPTLISTCMRRKVGPCASTRGLEEEEKEAIVDTGYGRRKRLWTRSMGSRAWARGGRSAFRQQALMSGVVGGGGDTMECVDAGR